MLRQVQHALDIAFANLEPDDSFQGRKDAMVHVVLVNLPADCIRGRLRLPDAVTRISFFQVAVIDR